MNDQDVLTTVRDGFAQVQMTTPADAVVTRGQSLRRRRHAGRLAAAGALAGALGAGLTVSALTASQPAAQRATLAAWTVSQQPGGTLTVTVRELRDLSALQHRLAADGAAVTISDTTLTLPHGCVAPASASQMPAGMITFSSRQSGGYVFQLRPSLIPGGQVLRILLIPGPMPATPPVTVANGKPTVHGGPVTGNARLGVFYTLVKNAARCTS